MGTIFPERDKRALVSSHVFSNVSAIWYIIRHKYKPENFIFYENYSTACMTQQRRAMIEFQSCYLVLERKITAKLDLLYHWIPVSWKDYTQIIKYWHCRHYQLLAAYKHHIILFHLTIFTNQSNNRVNRKHGKSKA